MSKSQTRPTLPYINPGFEITRKPAGGWLLGAGGGYVLDMVNTLSSRAAVIGSTITRVPGPRGTVLNFAGDNTADRIDLGTVPADHPLQLIGDFAIFWRFRIVGATVPNTAQRIIQKSTTTGSSNGYILFGTPTQLKFTLNGSSTSATNITPGLIQDQWHTLIIRRSGNTIAWYMDGALVTGGQSLTTAASNSAAPAAIGNFSDGGVDREWRGDIDFIFIANSSVSRDEAEYLTRPGNEYLIFHRDADFPFAAFSSVPATRVKSGMFIAA